MITESDSRELIHDGYVMYIHHQDCQHCDCSEEYSQLYEVWIHPSKTRISGFRDLRPPAGPIKDLSITPIALPARPIPCCSECIMTYKPRGTSSVIPLATRDEWTATLKRKYTPAAQAPAKPARQPQTPTLDQI